MPIASWVLLAFMLLLFVAFVPVWPYSAAWGYYPSAGVGFLFLLFLILALVGAFAAVSEDGRV